MTDTSPTPAPARTWRRRAAIAVAAAAVMLPAMTAGALVNFRITRDEAIVFGSAWLDATGASIEAESERLAELAASPLKDFLKYPDLTENPERLGHPHQSQMLSIVMESPIISGVYLGYLNRRGVEAIDIRDSTPEVRRKMRAPDNAAYAVWWVWNEATTTTGEWVHLGEDLAPVGIYSINEPRYLPDHRPWFQGAQANSGLAATAPMLVASTGRPGISVSLPVEVDTHVLAVDTPASWINTAVQVFVDKLEFGVTGALIAGDGNVVAAFGTQVRDGGDTLLTVPLLRSKGITAAMDAYEDKKAPYAPRLQQVGGRPTLATVRVPPFPFGEGETALVLSAPLATFKRLGARGVGAGAATGAVILLGMLSVFLLVSRSVARGSG